MVLASFDSSRRAEHMLASLGRTFRKDANKNNTTAVVVTGNADGSLKVTQSRVLTAGGLAYILTRISLAWVAGFTGLFSGARGTPRGIRGAAEVRGGHVGQDEQRAHDILAEAGPNAAIALVRCKDRPTRQMIASAAAETAIKSWDGPLTYFLADLDPGSAHDWVRTALRVPASPNRD